MFTKTITHAKLAWVYAKGICGFRRKVYDLQFVYVPEDKTWYIDMPWPGDRYNLAMVAGSNHLLTYLDFKREYKVRVLVRPTKKQQPPLSAEGYFECVKQFSGLFAGATYTVNGLDDFIREIWICPVTLTLLGHYPKYIYIKQLNTDGTPVDKDKYFEQLINTKFVEMNISVRLLMKLKELDIETIGDLLCRPESDIRKFGRNQDELLDILEALNLAWGNPHGICY